MLNEIILNKIKESIQTELLKRGFITPIELSIKITRTDTCIIEIKSANFQTVPVIFKSIQLTNFGGSIVAGENGIISIWVPVNVAYTHFNHGSNGCEIFTFCCEIDGNDNIFNITIN